MTRKIVLDVENTTTKLNDKYADFSPYNPNNKLVSIGWMVMDDNKLGETGYVFAYHNEIAKHQTPDEMMELTTAFTKALKSSDTLIAHNAKYDIAWLEESGFKLSHLKIEDTMIREYVMARGRTDFSFKLADTCKRYKVAEKGEIFEKYPDRQISEMPIEEVEEYGRGDIQSCAELYLAQEERLQQDGYKGLRPTIDMMHEFCRVLSDMQRTGVKIDEAALQKVEAEYLDEAENLRFYLNSVIREVMGDTPVNLESPQQLSEVVYSRVVKPECHDKWLETFNIGKDERGKNLRRPKMSVREYVDNVKVLTKLVMKTKAERCVECSGIGSFLRLKKDGQPRKRHTKCKICKSTGIVYKELNELAGFHLKPKNSHWTTVNGFTTNQVFLEELVTETTDPKAKEFLEKLMRLSSVSSYLASFVGGIKVFKQNDSILHPNFNQCITATGRLSSTKPNIQNQPRETTFPIRKVFVSRFSGGSITEVDFAQLEFRAAIHLAKDEKGKEDILNGCDIHQQTANIITEAGQPITRQEAKSRTFKPLYGGVTGTEAERAYYQKFLKKIYTGVYAWHQELQDTAISKHIIELPTGRQYIFPDVQRAWHGGATKATQICNYPVQGFATADIVPCAIIRLAKQAQGLKSRIVLTVHDSIMVDTYPGEESIVIEMLKNVGDAVEEELFTRYGIKMFVPLTVEVKHGPNAMELKKVA